MVEYLMSKIITECQVLYDLFLHILCKKKSLICLIFTKNTVWWPNKKAQEVKILPLRMMTWVWCTKPPHSGRREPTRLPLNSTVRLGTSIHIYAYIYIRNKCMYKYWTFLKWVQKIMLFYQLIIISNTGY